jgi:hypothetical protein
MTRLGVALGPHGAPHVHRHDVARPHSLLVARGDAVGPGERRGVGVLVPREPAGKALALVLQVGVEEVDRRRAVAHNPPSMSHTPVRISSPGEDLARVSLWHVKPDELNEKIAQVRARPDDSSLLEANFVVDGWFVDLPDIAHARSPVRLCDEDGETDLVRVPREVLGDVRVDEHVRLFGRLCVEVSGGERACLLEVHTVVRGGRYANATAQRLYQQLCELRHDPVPFPSERPLRIALVAPAHGVADEDFRKALAPVKDRVQLDVHYVSISSTREVAAAIRSAQGHVVAVVRGGGDDLSVFDAPQVLYAMATKTAFRLAGIGHAPDRHLIELAVDHAADVPAMAGGFVRDRITQAETASPAGGDAASRAEVENATLRRQLAAQAQTRAVAEHQLRLEQAQLQSAREALAQARRHLHEAELRHAREARPQVVERLVPILPTESEWPMPDRQEAVDLQARVADLRWRVRTLAVTAVLLVIAATAGWVKFAEVQRRAAAAEAALTARAGPAWPATRHPPADGSPRHR